MSVYVNDVPVGEVDLLFLEDHPCLLPGEVSR